MSARNLPFFYPSYGGAPYREHTQKVIRLLLKGCTNRPFYHIAVQEIQNEVTDHVIEQIGSYDPLPNKYNEKLVSINFKRLEHWIRSGATLTDSVLKILGVSGYFPIHPGTFGDAWINKRNIIQELERLRITAASLNDSDKAKPSENNESPAT